MNWIERLASLFGANISPALTSQPVLDAARHAKFADDTDTALAALERALAGGVNPTSVYLQRADVLINAGRFDDAEQALNTARSLTDVTIRPAVTLMTGWLAQSRGDWGAARACYEQALTEARGVHAVSLEGNVMSRLADTYLHEGNASYAAHLLREALPRLSAPSDVEMSSYFVGLLGQAMIQNGQTAEGHHLIGRALVLAEQIGYVRYLRLWSVVMGERAAAEARYQDAKIHFSRALGLYRVPSVEQVQTLCHVSQTSLALRELFDALNYARRAVEIAESLGDEHAALVARGVLGVALRTAGHAEEAMPHLQAAADALEQGDVLRALAAAQVDSGDTDGAIATCRRAIAQAETTGVPLEVAGARRDLGLIYLRRGDLTVAIQEWTSALAIFEQHKAYAQVARLYCDIGNARKMLGQAARAMKEYEQALMTLNSVEEYDVETRGLVLSSAANAYAEQGDVESADSFFNESITIAARMGDSAAESTRSGNYGYFLLMVGRPRRAIAMLERALRMSQMAGLVLQSAVQIDNLGLAYDALSDYEAARGYHEKALDLVEAAANPHWAAIIRVNLANTLLALEQPDDAEPLLESALAYGRESENTEIIARALTAMGLLAVKRGEPQAAEPLLNEAVTLARRGELRRWLAEALAVRSQQLGALGQIEQAGASWEEAQRLFTMLHMPQAKLEPAWLSSAPPAAR